MGDVEDREEAEEADDAEDADDAGDADDAEDSEDVGARCFFFFLFIRGSSPDLRGAESFANSAKSTTSFFSRFSERSLSFSEMAVNLSMMYFR